jgi:hypothetical protein
MKKIWWVCAVSVMACGGGGSDGPSSPTPVAPSITAQPQSATVVVGQAAQFSVTAAGSTPMTFQWRRNGAPVGTNSASYTIAAAATTDAGAYDVVITNPAGSVTSTAATLTVAPPVAVTISSGPATLGTGASATYAATVTGSATTTVTWSVQEQGGGTISSAGVYTAPAAAGTYTIVATSTADNTKQATRSVTVFAAGNLRVGQGGLPPGVAATISVAGPNGFTGSLTQVDQTLSGVPVGAYTLTFNPVTVSGGTFAPVDPGPSTTVNVTLNNTTLFSVAYAPQPGTGRGSIAATGTAVADHLSPMLFTLSTGRILVVGGLSSTTEEYDVATGTFSSVGTHGGGTSFETAATMLADGRVLYSGGNYPDATTRSRLYDPVARTWSGTGNMGTARRQHTLTTLPNGRVLAVGGRDSSGTYVSTAELYDPVTGTWTATGSMQTARGLHSATLLADGRVLIVGGQDNATSHRTADVYNPATGQFTRLTAQLQFNRSYHAAIRLTNGTVVILAGTGSGDTRVVEVFAPGADTFSAAGSLLLQHAYAGVTLLPNGQILVTGGQASGVSIATTEIFNPATGATAFGPQLTATRQEHASLLLSNGKVLIAGGRGTNNVVRRGADIYTP